MQILIIGGGGREHALAWKIAQSPRATRVYVAPGNAGTAREPKCENVTIAADDVEGLLRFARDQRIDLTVVGPEVPLVAGIVNRFNAAKLKCFGPTKECARLEGSKLFAKEFLRQHNIPTANYWETTDYGSSEFLADHPEISFPCVLKADGLAAGKGVIIVNTREEFSNAAREIQSLGAAGAHLVIEEFLVGEEVSSRLPRITNALTTPIRGRTPEVWALTRRRRR